MDLISIIVPVYNAGKFLDRCIDSILNQTYENIEVILVNDGSTDNSGKLCEMYAHKDHRVKVIHQENSGPSIARNIGLEKANGTYIQFVDADDYIDEKMTETLVNEINKNADIVICAYKIVSKKIDGKLDFVYSNSYRYPQMNKIEFLDEFGQFFKDYYVNYIWNKLYKACTIKKNNIRFDTSIKWGEDLIFNLNYLNYCDKITIIDEPLYNYVNYNDFSITTSYNKDLYINQQFMYKQVRDFLKSNNAYTTKNEIEVEKKYTACALGWFSNLFSDEANLKKTQIYKKIEEIVEDNTIREKLDYFNNNGIENKIIGIMVKNRAINLLFYYFRFRSYIKKHLYSLIFLLSERKRNREIYNSNN